MRSTPFRQVYFHRTLRAAEAVLMSILRRAVALLQSDQLRFIAKGSVMERVLRGEELSISEYLTFDDHLVMFHLKQWVNEPDALLSDLAQRFIYRRLFKTVTLNLSADERAEFIAAARLCVEQAGFDPTYYLIEDRAADIPYYSYYRPEGKGRLFIDNPDGSGLCDIAEVSQVIGAMRGYELHRVCCPREALPAIEGLL